MPVIAMPGSGIAPGNFGIVGESLDKSLSFPLYTVFPA